MNQSIRTLPALPFNLLLRRQREDLSLTQRAAAEKLGVSQSVWSLWETGRTIPDREQFDGILVLLKVDPRELAPAYERAVVRETSEPLSLERILGQAKEYLDSQNQKFSIYVLGPSNLPVLEEQHVREFWMTNLRAGHDYHLLWMLDYVDAETLVAALPNFSNLVKGLVSETTTRRRSAGDCGKIHHYAIGMQSDETKYRRDIYLEFRESVAPMAGPDHIVAHDILLLSEGDATSDLARVVGDMRRLWHPETALLLYRPSRTSTPAVANIRLMPISAEMEDGLIGTVVRPTYWVSPGGAARFRNLIDKLMKKVPDTASEGEGKP